MKPHFKPPANHLQPAWHKATRMLILLIILIASLFAGMASASVPLSWQVTPRNPSPVSFDRHHGETLELRCTFTGFGELPFSGSGAVAPRLYYQTNGMAAAWWSVPASVSSNVLSATFPPSADPGTDRLALFFGAPSNAYASAVLRLRHSPGFTPNVLPAPEPGYVEQDPTVPAWAKAETPPASGITTNDVCNIMTNVVGVLYGKWQVYTNGVYCETGEVYEFGWLEENGGFYYEIVDRPYADLFFDTFVTDSTNFAYRAGTGRIGDVTFPYYIIRPTTLNLVRLIDLPTLTNNIQASIAASATASSNYTDDAIATFTPAPAGRSWNRPGEWSLSYEPVLAEESSAFDSFTTNEFGMVFSNAISRTVRGLSARVFPDMLDPFTDSAPPPVSLAVPDGTVEGGIVSVPSNGIYRVRGTTASGEAREIPVPFASGAVNEKAESTYVADRASTARKLANDFSASALASMTDAGTAAYIGETNRFRVWRTIQPTFAWPGVGNTTPFALSPHVMVTAAHYPTWNIDRWTSNTLTNWISGSTFSVRRGPSVHLADWAATNGFTAAEIALAGDLTDVAMIPLVEGTIPSECCPFLASVDWLAEHYGDLEGICAWAITQGSAYWSPPANGNALLWAIPVILRGGSLTAANTWMAAGGIRPGMVARQDIAAAIGKYNDRSWYEIRGGDSGKPVWICDMTAGERRDILISHFHTVGSGPNYAAALTILRAYCAAHGDTLKEVAND